MPEMKLCRCQANSNINGLGYLRYRSAGGNRTYVWGTNGTFTINNYKVIDGYLYADLVVDDIKRNFIQTFLDYDLGWFELDEMSGTVYFFYEELDYYNLWIYENL